MPDPIGTRNDSPYTPAFDPSEASSCNQESETAPSVVSSSMCSLEESGPAPESQRIGGPHAEAHTDPNDLYAGAFAIKGRDAESGLELEVFSVSVHNGHAQGETQAAAVRVGMSSDDGHFDIRGEAFTAKAHLGMQNPDGSVGLNAGIGVTAVGIEGTGTLGPLSATIGASISANLAGSVGIRDGDHDGKAEICARAELTVMTFGLCIERPW